MLVGHFVCVFRTVAHEASRVNALDLSIYRESFASKSCRELTGI